ncbi:hypothetical protein B0T10DRAFT_466773 [Thelonectria olida]|uniref:TauD/TfdA-like domain-containing protein n=1 Tax=Thelonectria olida TaxID=1576542 RepID=A0A9P8VQZ8_9HYPO|nr:hypothetical protein B0T10DRAFT_466773 [Thelonectria olida]
MSATTTETKGTINVKLAFDTALHNAYLPVWDETTTFPLLQPFEFNDRGLVTNNAKRNLLLESDSDIKVDKTTLWATTRTCHMNTNRLESQSSRSGGDTAWTSQTGAYARLSTPIKPLLEGLRAEHSGHPQAENSRRDGKHIRRQPVKSEHPIVRIHRATGQKTLFVQPRFTKRITGLTCVGRESFTSARTRTPLLRLPSVNLALRRSTTAEPYLGGQPTKLSVITKCVSAFADWCMAQLQTIRHSPSQ